MALNLDDLLGSKETDPGKETVSSKETVGGKETVTAEKTDAPTTTEKPKRGRSTGTGKAEVAKKPKGKPRGGNSPVIGDNGLMLQEGDNSKFLEVQMALFNMPNIDMDNADEVARRLSDYFALYNSHDMKPTVAGMAIALNGHNRTWLWAVTHDQPIGGRGNKPTLRPDVTNAIKKAYFLLENLWETYMNSGKVNPVAGIFLGKNNYGYQDKTEYVLTPNQQQEADYDPNEIRERYIAADQQKRLSDHTTISDADGETTGD